MLRQVRLRKSSRRRLSNRLELDKITTWSQNNSQGGHGVHFHSYNKYKAGTAGTSTIMIETKEAVTLGEKADQPADRPEPSETPSLHTHPVPADPLEIFAT